MPATSMLMIFSLAVGAQHASAADRTVVLLDEDFSVYRPGQFSSVVGAHTEYHYLPEAASNGNWVVSTFRSSPDTQRAWRVVEADDAPAIQQTYRNKWKHYHPMIVAGDAAWGDYSIELQFTPERDDAFDPVESVSIVGTDGERHTRLRNVVNRGFTPARIEALSDDSLGTCQVQLPVLGTSVARGVS